MSGVKANPGFTSGTNLSDVIDVIVADSETGPGPTMAGFQNNMTYASPQPAPARPVMESRSVVSNSSSANAIPDLEAKRRAYVKILEQPASKALRFRYECEGRSAGSIPGANSTTDNKSFPAIQVVGYRGKAVVVVSCVTKDPPYRPHPHSLVGKEGCNKGVCTMHISNENMMCTFSNLGIQCVKKKGIDDALRQREEVRVDPFKTGFGHRNQPQSIDLNAVRLCFQVFLEGAQKDRFTFPLKPVVSDPIYDKKAMCDLNICKLSDCTSPVSGGKDVILLCDKVTKDDIQIRFYEENEGHIVWEGFGDFQSSDVHKQVAISFRTPRYKNLDIPGPVSTCIQLVRPSDKAASEPRPFQYLPLDSDAEVLKRKRLRLADSNNSRLAAYIRDSALESQRLAATASSCNDFNLLATSRPVLRPSVRPKVKQEPIDHVEMGGAYYVEGDASPNTLQSNYNTMNMNLSRFPMNPALSPGGSGTPLFVAPPTPSMHLLPPSPNYPISVSPGSLPAYGLSPGSSVAQSPGNHNNYNIPLSHSPSYNIPASPYINDAGASGMGTSIMDLDRQFIEPQATLDLHELPSINLPLSESNLSCLDSHMLENLSLLDVGTGVKTTTGNAGVEQLSRNPQQDSVRPKESNYNQPAPTTFSMELTDLSLSGLLSGTELDGGDSISSTIKELDALNAMSGKSQPS